MPIHRGQAPEHTDLLDALDVIFFGRVSATGRKDRYITLDNLLKTLDRPRFIRDTAPTVDDDVLSGVETWNRWVDTTGPTIYICLDNTAGAADWDILHDWSS